MPLSTRLPLLVATKIILYHGRFCVGGSGLHGERGGLLPYLPGCTTRNGGRNIFTSGASGQETSRRSRHLGLVTIGSARNGIPAEQLVVTVTDPLIGAGK